MSRSGSFSVSNLLLKTRTLPRTFCNWWSADPTICTNTHAKIACTLLLWDPQWKCASLQLADQNRTGLFPQFLQFVVSWSHNLHKIRVFMHSCTHITLVGPMLEKKQKQASLFVYQPLAQTDRRHTCLLTYIRRQPHCTRHLYYKFSLRKSRASQ